MAKGPRYIVKFRRLRERRTNYKLRLAMLKSGKPLFTVRRSLRYIYVSLSIPKIGGDETLLTVSSKILLKYKFYGLKNISAAYLTGYIAGKLALQKGIKEAIINLGYAWTNKASIPFAAAIGARDAGLDIPLGEDKRVDISRIRGEHIAYYARGLKQQNPELYNQRFSKYIGMKVYPEKLPELFDKVLNEIKKDYGGEPDGK